jgi:hypothetical protein
VAAIGTEQLDLFVPQFLPMAIKFALALRAGHPKNFCHGALPPGPNFGSSGFLVDNATWSQNIGSPQRAQRGEAATKMTESMGWCKGWA